MSRSVVVQVFRVFVDSGLHFGNPVGIVADTARALDDTERVKICQRTGFSEIVYIEDIEEQRVRIYNPQEEIDFSGHAGIGAASYLSQLSKANSGNFNYRIGIASYVHVADLLWIATDKRGLPPWNLRELSTIEEVEAFGPVEASKLDHTVIWSWLKDMRTIRARTFAPDWGIPEDEANGSGAMLLTMQLKQDLTIIHGKGSVIYTKFTLDNTISVGGRVAMTETLRITL